MSDVKHKSLANANVRISTVAHNSIACMKAPSEEIYGKSMQAT